VALPIVAGGNFYGILRFSSLSAQRRLTPGQIKALDILASTAAAAFEAASLLTQLRTLNQDLEHRVRERTQELQAPTPTSKPSRIRSRTTCGHRCAASTASARCSSTNSAPVCPRMGAACSIRPCGRGPHESTHRRSVALARFSRQPLQMRPVQMNALVRGSWRTFEAITRVAAYSCRSTLLPDCVADGSLLEQVFTNLFPTRSSSRRPIPTRTSRSVVGGRAGSRSTSSRITVWDSTCVCRSPVWSLSTAALAERVRGYRDRFVHRAADRAAPRGKTWAESTPQQVQRSTLACHWPRPRG
jgi:hypothetical protein